MSTHRRIVIARRGGPEVLEVVEESLPEPGPGEIRLRTLAAGVSAHDLMLRSGWFPGFPKPPFTPGVDVVGEIEASGGDVGGLRPGVTVAALLPGDGGYAETIVVGADRAVPVPDGVDPGEAVCVVANYLTAHAMLHRAARVEEGERILVQGAGGGVGTAILQLGRLAGLEMYGTASPHNHGLVASLGATPIDYHRDDPAERIRALTGDGVDAVFDPIGGARQLWRSYRALRKGGRLIWFGVAAVSTKGTRVIPASLATRTLLAMLPDGKKAPMPPNAGEPIEAYRGNLAWLLERLATGDVDPVVEARVPIIQARRAHELLEAGRYAGKVVLVGGE